MSTKCQNNEKRVSAAEVQFHDYIRDIQEAVISTYGPSYAEVDKIRNKWREIIRWSKEIEDFLILKSKIYIKTLDYRAAKSTDLAFLKSLTKLMADYLSGYGMNKPGTSRRQSKEQIFARLWTENSYIIGLQLSQAKKRYDRKYNNNYNKTNKNKQKTPEQARQQYQTSIQIKMLFMDECKFKSKKR